MVIVVLLVLAIFVLQNLMIGRWRVPPAPGAPSALAESLGNRDNVRPLTLTGQRLARAIANMQESLPVFITLALMNMIVAPGAELALTGAWIFLAARIVYCPLYMVGVPVVRTLAWAASWVGMALMISVLLKHI